MGIIDKLLAVATNELGYLEKASNKNLNEKTANAGSANYTKYGAYFNINPAQWCDLFVDWCFCQTFGKEDAKILLCGGFSAYTPTSAQYFKNKKQWFTTPKKGDVIFYKNSTRICHTGLVYNVDSRYVYTIEGNTSGASGVVPNGGGVCKKKYSLSYSSIAGYGRPNYSFVDIPFEWSEETMALIGTIIATELNIRKEPTTDADIVGKHVEGDKVSIVAKTNNDWYKVEYPNLGSGYIHSKYVDVTASLDNTPDTWGERAVQNAINKEIIVGNDNGDYKLHSNCTRQDFLIFLYRLHNKSK